MVRVENRKSYNVKRMIFHISSILFTITFYLILLSYYIDILGSDSNHGIVGIIGASYLLFSFLVCCLLSGVLSDVLPKVYGYCDVKVYAWEMSYTLCPLVDDEEKQTIDFFPNIINILSRYSNLYHFSPKKESIFRKIEFSKDEHYFLYDNRNNDEALINFYNKKLQTDIEIFKNEFIKSPKKIKYKSPKKIKYKTYG